VGNTGFFCGRDHGGHRGAALVSQQWWAVLLSGRLLKEPGMKIYLTKFWTGAEIEQDEQRLGRPCERVSGMTHPRCLW
jgi:hypothetical protein